MNILKEYGWQGLLLGAVLFLLYSFLGEGLKTLSEKAKNKLLQKKEAQLKMHAFFNAMSYSLNVEIQAMTLFNDKPIRQTLLKDLVYCSLASVEEVAERIAETDHSKWNYTEWNYEMRSALNEMNTEFVQKCVNRGMPEIVYKKYLVWYFERLNYMRIFIDQIAGTESYATPESKTSALFLMFNLFLVTFIGDAERTLKELNGEISGLHYKGGIVEPLLPHSTT